MTKLVVHEEVSFDAFSLAERRGYLQSVLFTPAHIPGEVIDQAAVDYINRFLCESMISIQSVATRREAASIIFAELNEVAAGMEVRQAKHMMQPDVTRTEEMLYAYLQDDVARTLNMQGYPALARATDLILASHIDVWRGERGVAQREVPLLGLQISPVTA